jgi:hypothetical protein
MELVPLRGTTFRIRDRTGIAVEFLAGAGGAIDRIAWYDGGSSIGRRIKK